MRRRVRDAVDAGLVRGWRSAALFLFCSVLEEFGPVPTSPTPLVSTLVSNFSEVQVVSAASAQ